MAEDAGRIKKVEMIQHSPGHYGALTMMVAATGGVMNLAQSLVPKVPYFWTSNGQIVVLIVS